MLQQLLWSTMAPTLALGLGLLLTATDQTKTAGYLFGYAGGQTWMTLYMKHMFSQVRIAEDSTGIPAAFLITAFEQLVAFALLLAWAAASRLTQRRYRPVPLRTWRDGALVGLFALTLTTNIALNNFSISLMPVSVNLLIRSCFPLPTLGLQHLVAKVFPASGIRANACSTGELLMVLAGCAFA